jgi:hypothetical protein
MTGYYRRESAVARGSRRDVAIHVRLEKQHFSFPLKNLIHLSGLLRYSGCARTTPARPIASRGVGRSHRNVAIFVCNFTSSATAPILLRMPQQDQRVPRRICGPNFACAILHKCGERVGARSPRKIPQQLRFSSNNRGRRFRRRPRSRGRGWWRNGRRRLAGPDRADSELHQALAVEPEVCLESGPGAADQLAALEQQSLSLLGLVLLDAFAARSSRAFLPRSRIQAVRSGVLVAISRARVLRSRALIAVSRVGLARSRALIAPWRVFVERSRVFLRRSRVFLQRSGVFLPSSRILFHRSGVFLHGSRILFHRSGVFLHSSRISDARSRTRYENSRRGKHNSRAGKAEGLPETPGAAGADAGAVESPSVKTQFAEDRWVLRFEGTRYFGGFAGRISTRLGSAWAG